MTKSKWSFQQYLYSHKHLHFVHYLQIVFTAINDHCTRLHPVPLHHLRPVEIIILAANIVSDKAGELNPLSNDNNKYISCYCMYTLKCNTHIVCIFIQYAYIQYTTNFTFQQQQEVYQLCGKLQEDQSSWFWSNDLTLAPTLDYILILELAWHGKCGKWLTATLKYFAFL